jgi:hypothetical protein
MKRPLLSAILACGAAAVSTLAVAQTPAARGLCTAQSRSVADQFTRALDWNRLDEAYGYVDSSAFGSAAAFKQRFAARTQQLGGRPLYTEYASGRFAYAASKQSKLAATYARRHLGAAQVATRRGGLCRHTYTVEYPHYPMQEQVSVGPVGGRPKVVSFQDG